jgi:hypothetical protein
MFSTIYNKIRNLLNREEGQGMVEYTSSMERYAHKGGRC